MRFFIVLLSIATLPLPALADGSEAADFVEFCTNPPDQAAAQTVAILMRALQDDDCALGDARARTLTQISLPREGLTDLRPIGTWTWMTGLEFTGNDISDASPLKTIQALKQAYLNDNRIENLEFVRSLPALFRLRIGGNQISDLEPLRGHPALQDADLSRNAGYTDMSPLAGLPLVRLALADAAPGADVAAMLPLPKLESLDYGRNGLVDLAPLAAPGALPAIRTLRLPGNQIVDAAPLAQLSTLTALDVSDNPIADLMPLTALTGVVALNVSRVPAPHVTDVVRAMRLKELLAAGHGLADLAWTDALAAELRTLDLTDNALTEVTALTRFKDLGILKLGGNPITDVDTDWLASLTQLKELEIDVWRIESATKRAKVLEVMLLAFERNRG